MEKLGGRFSILSFIIAAALLAALVALGYFISHPFKESPFTEFYILGTGGKASGYPSNLSIGDTGQVIVGIISHEDGPTEYRVTVTSGGFTRSQEGPVTLAIGQKWEKIVSFTPDSAGDNQKVEFFLYRGNDPDPYLKPLSLFVNVRTRS